MHRREAIRWLAGLTAALAAPACTPLRIISGAFPAALKEDGALARVLRAFVATVLPGLPDYDDTTFRVLRDQRYPFARFAPFFASDLSRRAQEQFGNPAFDELTALQRTTVIATGLRAGGTTTKLYRGAIYLTQIAFYAGIYDDDAGCATIDFAGRFHDGDITYPNPRAFLPVPLTGNGNAA